MLYPAIRSLLSVLEPERAHRTTLAALEIAHALGLAAPRAESRPRTVMGLTFPNAVGLAAGFDKDGEHVDALAGLGLGFIEVGTVTPRRQPGNPRPRLWRLPESEALINRMGFNNAGVGQLVRNIARARRHCLLGVSIGPNHDTPLERAADDYVACLRAVHAHADFVTANISSPGTPGLRDLQDAAHLDPLLGALTLEKRRLDDAHARRVPLAVKIAPDLTPAGIEAMVDRLVAHGVDGVIATNSTLARPGVTHATPPGGLSGAPLRAMALDFLRRLAFELHGRIPIIACGGIMSAADARERMEAGASLVQVFTGLVYRGPALVREISAALG